MFANIKIFYGKQDEINVLITYGVKCVVLKWIGLIFVVSESFTPDKTLQESQGHDFP